MAVKKEVAETKENTVQAEAMEVIRNILTENKSPKNPQQLESLRVAVEMYNAFKA